MGLILTTVPRKRTLLFQRLLLLSFFLPAIPALAQTPAITATVDVAKTGGPISKNIYGQFLEHGGDIVNAGIWSEMLVDRKFFYPVATVAPTSGLVTGVSDGSAAITATVGSVSTSVQLSVVSNAFVPTSSTTSASASAALAEGAPIEPATPALSG